MPNSRDFVGRLRLSTVFEDGKGEAVLYNLAMDGSDSLRTQS